MSSVVRRLWDKLRWVVPSGDTEVDQRRLLLAGVLTIGLGLAGPVGLVLIPVGANPSAPTETEAFKASLALTPFLLLCWMLNRWSVRRYGAFLYVVAVMISTLWAAHSDPFILGFMSLEMLLAMAILPLKYGIGLSLAGLLAHSVLLLGAPTLEEIALPWVLNLTALFMVVAVQWHYSLWEGHRLFQVKQSQQWFQTTLSSIGDAVLAVDPKRRITFMNPVAEALTGWSGEEALEQPMETVFCIVHATSGETAKNPVDEVLGSKTTVGLANHTLLVSKEGIRRPIADSAAPIVGPAGELWGAVLVFRDMSREHEIAAQLQHSHRLEALGQLAGGVAHDFNNLLTAIAGGLELAAADIVEGNDPSGEIDAIRQACEQASGLTRQLLAFSRRQVMQSKPIMLQDALERNQRLLQRLLRDDIVVESKLAEPCWVLVDPVQLDQVVMNLAINAGDAMPDGGTLTLEASEVEVTPEHPIGSLRPGRYGQLRVSDTGVGIAEVDRARIFEPFFTTKEQDRGTGLGLATAYGIAQQSGGGITVQSVVGEGTTFNVYFPAATAQELGAATEADPPESKRPAQKRRVLVVEDDPLVRSLMTRVLVQAGHDVVQADSGSAALARLEDGQTFDLLLTDIVMPEMKGTILAAAFSERFPNTPVLFTSGYADEVVAQRGLSGPQQSFIAKPFTPQGLGKAVNRALSSQRS